LPGGLERLLSRLLLLDFVDSPLNRGGRHGLACLFQPLNGAIPFRVRSNEIAECIEYSEPEDSRSHHLIEQAFVGRQGSKDLYGSFRARLLTRNHPNRYRIDVQPWLARSHQCFKEAGELTRRKAPPWPWFGRGHIPSDIYSE